MTAREKFWIVMIILILVLLLDLIFWWFPAIATAFLIGRWSAS